jgi:hypothetical protein
MMDDEEKEKNNLFILIFRMRSTREGFHLRIKTHFIAFFNYAKEEKLYNSVFSVKERTAEMLILVREIKKETSISYTLCDG